MRYLRLTGYMAVLAGMAVACAGPEPADTLSAAEAGAADVAPSNTMPVFPGALESTFTPAPASSTEAETPFAERESVSGVMAGPGSVATKLDMELKLFDGKTLRLSDIKGHVIILNFWGSWCPPCRKEMPSFQRIWEEYRERGVVVVGVAVLDSMEEARAFADTIGVTYPLGLDNGGQFVRSYRVTNFPTTFLIDREGNESRRINNVANEGVLRIFLRGLIE